MIERTRLDSQITVVTERMPAASSVAFGAYFPTGSRFETARNNGISHFLEHLLFKGTRRRTGEEINREIDLLGGGSNAYTTKETLCLHARVLPEHLPSIVALYGEMAREALPPGIEPELEREREVILQEIAATDDAPEEVAGELCDRLHFGDHPLGLPVTGSTDAVGALAVDELRSHLHEHLGGRGLVVAAAGRLEHEAVLALVTEAFGSLAPGRRIELGPPSTVAATSSLLPRDLEQVHVCLAARGVSRRDPTRHAADVLSCILGEGYSSRLFREVRDRRGLAYSVFSSLSPYLDVGSLNVYVGTGPERLAETLETISRELGALCARGVDEAEVEQTKRQLRGALLLGHESTGARMGYLAEQALLESDRLDFDQELEGLAAVSQSDVNALGRELLSGPLAIAAVGPADAGQLPAGGLEPAP